MRKHYHVNTFHVGCLNDASDGPFTNKRDAVKMARSLVREYKEEGRSFEETHTYHGQVARWQAGTLVIAVEECAFPDCDGEIDW